MGAKGFEHHTAAEIMAEISKLTPSLGGVNYKRLDEGSLQWPCPSEDHPGTCILHESVFSRPSGKGNFVPVKYRPSEEQTDAQYPILLFTGRRLIHYHATMTRKVDILNILMGEEEFRINPAEAAPLGIRTGDRVKVSSQHGEVKVKAIVTGQVPPGTAHMAFHFADCPTNNLVSADPATLDPVTGTPAYKTCPVKVAKIEAATSGEKIKAMLYRATQENDFAYEFRVNPDRVAAEYKLTDAEKAAVISRDVKKVEALAGKLDEHIEVWLEATKGAKGKP
jgi:predicted molibdopterin-dependent oxidoreductase YjgC